LGERLDRDVADADDIEALEADYDPKLRQAVRIYKLHAIFAT